jgi:integrase
MASVQKHGKGWRVQLFVDGRRLSKVLPTKQQAAAWALQAEAELAGHTLPTKTLADALMRYSAEVSPTHRGQRWERVRIAKLLRDPLAARRLSSITTAELAEWRDAQLATLAPSSVAREMTLLRSVLEACRRDWHWLRVNPIREVRWPKAPPSRKRRITPAEVDAVCVALGQSPVSSRVRLAFLFALETAMRSGEIVGLRWPDVDLEARTVRLARTKNGDSREVPLSTRAVEILSALPVTPGPVFGVSGPVRDTLFRKAVRAAGVENLHFHDARAEAIWRLSKRLDVLQLARVIGHRDPRSLMLYYQESAQEMARRLD